MPLGDVEQTLVFEADYGNRPRLYAAVEPLLERYDKDVLTGVCLFVNNNPYNLEVFLSLTFAQAPPGTGEQVRQSLAAAGAKLRPDITGERLLEGVGERRFNMVGAVDGKTFGEQAEGAFLHRSREEMSSTWPGHPMRGAPHVFISHSSHDKPEVAELVARSG